MTGLRSGELARAAGVGQQTLRYYERRGLLAEPPRTAGGHRLYPPEELTRLRAIKAAQRLGFSLGEAAELVPAAPPRRRQRAGKPLADRLTTRLAEVESAIAELQVVAAALRATLEAGCTDLTECAGQPRCPVPFQPG
ncbi:MAG TPA: MerR family transcriptional regulator [Streptosporangiaceae bacterium]|nr:MerR family transcriptional regulator [Streptosporangiaceae bacterium]